MTKAHFDWSMRVDIDSDSIPCLVAVCQFYPEDCLVCQKNEANFANRGNFIWNNFA